MTASKTGSLVRVASVAGGLCVLLLISLSLLKLQRGTPSQAASDVSALQRANRVDSVFIASSVVFWTGFVIVTARRSSRAAAGGVAVLIAAASVLDVAENVHRVSEARAVAQRIVLEGSLWATYLAAATVGIALGRDRTRWLRTLGVLGPIAGLSGLLGLRPAVLLWLVAWHLGGAVFLWQEPSRR